MSTSSSIAADEDLEEIRRASSSSSSSSLRHHWPSSLLASSPPGGGRLLTKCSTTSNSPTSAELLHSQCQALLPLICASAPRVTFTMQEEMHNSEASNTKKTLSKHSLSRFFNKDPCLCNIVRSALSVELLLFQEFFTRVSNVLTS